MDKGYEKEGFAGMRIKISVAKRFRRFSKRLGKSQSMTLLTMMDFFEINELSPNDRLGDTVSSLKFLIKKRLNAVIAIIKDIEKHQTKPSVAMLHRLFEEASKEEEEDFDFGSPVLISENEELQYYRENQTKIQGQLQSIGQDFEKVLGKVKYVKGGFGSGYLKLEMTKEEFERLKQRSDYVRNHHGTENG